MSWAGRSNLYSWQAPSFFSREIWDISVIQMSRHNVLKKNIQELYPCEMIENIRKLDYVSSLIVPMHSNIHYNVICHCITF